MFVTVFFCLQVQASFFFKELDWRLKGPLRRGYGLIRMIQKTQFDRVDATLGDSLVEREGLLREALMAAHLMDAPEAFFYLVQNVREVRDLLTEEYVKASTLCDARITTRWRPFIIAFGDEKRVNARILAEFHRLDLFNARHTHQEPPITIYQLPTPGTFGACYQIPQSWPYRFDDYELQRRVNQMPAVHYRGWVEAAARYRAPDVEVSAVTLGRSTP